MSFPKDPKYISGLKACPFCGGNYQTMSVIEYGYYSVACECGVHGPAFEHEPDAKKEWNRRIKIME